jgi:serine protease
MEERRWLAPRWLATILVSSIHLAGLSAAAAAGEAASAPRSNELIVLLAAAGPGMPSAEEVVNEVRQRQQLQPKLGPPRRIEPLTTITAGAPVGAHFLVADRAQGETLRRLRAEKDTPRARLERYVVLTYPPGTDLEPVKRALAADPRVLNVEENVSVPLSITPSDPLFPRNDPVHPDPTQYQWGSHTLNFDLAWNWTTGHAYVGLTDNGLNTTHPDLGNFRSQFSRDLIYQRFGEDPTNVDEMAVRQNFWLGQSCEVHCGPGSCSAPGCAPECQAGSVQPNAAGHGTHTSGIVAATANNGIGVAGGCWNCSLMMAKTHGLHKGIVPPNTTVIGNDCGFVVDLAAGTTWLVDHGAQLISASLGRQEPGGCANSDLSAWCQALAYMDSRDIVEFASSGNFETAIDFPASDPRVIAVGGIDPTGNLWADSGIGSNFGPEQALVAPAKSVVSTFYPDQTWNPAYACAANLAGGYSDGHLRFGDCTGTSMASPYAAAVGALVRSVNPLLTKANVKSILTSTASHAGSWNQYTGYGYPNASAAVQAALGTVGGRVLVNRLTPLFSLYSATATDSLYTTAPQMATAAIFDPEVAYATTGPPVPMYPSFPGAQCVVSPCLPATPGASVYIFTTENAPYAGAPPLVPLYRLSFRGTFNGNVHHRDTTYTTTSAGLAAFEGVGYKLDGIEGYIYSACTPEPQCIPNGAVRLYRLYNPNLDDWAIFPESELAQKQAAGYQHESCCNDVIGYVYPNVDTDGDGLIDGFELLIGTNPLVADSDCDGVSDGVEVLTYPYDDPLGPGCGGPPAANFIFTCSGLTCSFDASGTSSTAGITSYSWNFGDSTSGSGVSLNHAFAASGSYSVTLTVTDKILRQSSLMRVLVVTSAPALPAESYFALPRCRVLDTRNPPFSALNDGQHSIFQVTGICGIPSTAKAVSLTVTAVSPTGPGYMGVYPGDQPVAYVTAIDFSPARSPRATNTIVQLATNGTGTVGVQTAVAASPGQVHLILDVDGYFSEDASPAPGAQGPLGYQTITPCRIVDTRITGHPLVSGTASNFTVQGSCGIPPGAVTAALNAAIVAPSNLGHLTLWESNLSIPLASNLNWNAGISALANGARPTLGPTTPDLTASISSVAPGNTAHLVLDTMGYFKSGAPYKFHPIPQCRAVNTLQAGAGAPSLAAGTTRSFQIQGNCGVPVGAKAAFISTSVSAGSTTTGGLLLYFPSGGSPNGTSSVNFDAGEPWIASGAIVQLSNNNADLSVATSSNVDLIVKVFGYFQ